jgi:hypothetical protein
MAEVQELSTAEAPTSEASATLDAAASPAAALSPTDASSPASATLEAAASPAAALSPTDASSPAASSPASATLEAAAISAVASSPASATLEAAATSPASATLEAAATSAASETESYHIDDTYSERNTDVSSVDSAKGSVVEAQTLNAYDEKLKTKMESDKQNSDMYFVITDDNLEHLVKRVNNKLTEGYYVYHGIQNIKDQFLQTLVKLPNMFGEELWRVFNSNKSLFISTKLDKERALANDAAPFVLEQLQGPTKPKPAEKVNENTTDNSIKDVQKKPATDSTS